LDGSKGELELEPRQRSACGACFSCSISSDKLPDDAFKAEPLQYRNTTSRGSAMCLFSCRPSLARRPYAARSDAAGRRRSRMRRRNWRWPGTRLGAGDAITRAPGRPTRASWAVKGSGSTSLRSSGAGLPAPSANGCLAAFRVASYPYGGVRSWCR
jgi:hypothetical protein